MSGNSGAFGVCRDGNGTIRVEFYLPNGTLTSRTTFDQPAAVEFVQALLTVVLDPEPTR